MAAATPRQPHRSPSCVGRNLPLGTRRLRETSQPRELRGRGECAHLCAEGPGAPRLPTPPRRSGSRSPAGPRSTCCVLKLSQSPASLPRKTTLFLSPWRPCPPDVRRLEKRVLGRRWERGKTVPAFPARHPHRNSTAVTWCLEWEVGRRAETFWVLQIACSSFSLSRQLRRRRALPGSASEKSGDPQPGSPAREMRAPLAAPAAPLGGGGRLGGSSAGPKSFGSYSRCGPGSLRRRCCL